MQLLNVLIVGKGNSIDLIKQSKYLKKLYIASEQENKNAINIQFNTFKELATKCKALQIDLVIVEEEKWVLQGIADVLKNNFVNCLSVTAKWTQKLDKILLNKYDILTPLTLTFPQTPLMIKTGNISKKANSISEIVKIKQEIFNFSPEIAKNMYIEEYLEGDYYRVSSIFDGKNLLTFGSKNFTQIQLEKLTNYSENLQNLLISENADFIGFLNSKLIWTRDNWYNIGFEFNFSKPDIEEDFLFILISALYQKLNELNLYEKFS